jgi:hypothetical protein
MAIEDNTRYTTEQKHQALREMRRKRTRLIEDARVACAEGDAEGVQKKVAEVRRLDDIVISTLKADLKFAPNGPAELWDFKPIDEEDFMDKNPRAADVAKLSPFEQSVVMAKVERAKAQNLAKAEQNERLQKKSGRRGFKDWGTPLNPR